MANINISQILLKRGNTASAGAYVGPLGEVVIDTGLKSLRVQDGATPGGMSTLVTQADLSNVASAIAGISNLGNISQLLANLQGTNTAAITSNVSTLFSNAATQAGLINTINANIIAVNAAIITANTTQSSQIAGLQSQITGANAAIITANTALKGYTDAQISTAINNLINSAPGTLDTLGEIAANLLSSNSAIGSIVNSITSTNANVTAANAAIVTANTALKSYVDTQVTNLTANDVIQSSQIVGANAAIVTANTAMKGYVDAVTTAWTANAAAQASDITTLYANAATQLSQITAANTTISALQANVGGFYTWANLNYGTSSYANANVIAYLAGQNISSANIGGGQLYANTQINAINANIGGYYTWANANVAGLYNSILGANTAWTSNAASQAGLITTLTANAGAQADAIAGANAAIVTANTAMKGYVDAVTTAWTSNAASQAGLITTLTSNAGVQADAITTLTTNAATQQTSINSINANIGSFYTYANTTFGTSSYANANVASYLPTYTGNVQASSLLVSTSIISTGSSPAPVISGFSSISTIGSAANEGNITASGNLVASRGAFVTGNLRVISDIFTNANVLSPNYLFSNGVNILSTISQLNNGGYTATLNSAAGDGTLEASYLLGDTSVLSQGSFILTYAGVANKMFGMSMLNAGNAAIQATRSTTLDTNLLSFNFTTGNVTAIGNVIAPNYLFANGVNILSTVTGGAGTYSNADVVSMLAANTAVFVGNVGNVATVYPIQSNITQVYIGGNTAITSGNAGSPNSTHLMYNGYFAANGAILTRNTTTGISYMVMDASGIALNGYTGAVTANTVPTFNQFLKMNGTIGAQFSGAITTPGVMTSVGVTSTGAVAVNNSSGLTTNQTTIPLFTATATTINIGSSTSNVFVGNAVGTSAGNLTVRALGTINSVASLNSSGGYGNTTYTGITTTGGTGTGMIVTIVGAASGYLASATITNPGTGYRNGDTITIPAGNPVGSLGATFTLANYNSNYGGGSTTAGAIYTFGLDGNLTLPGNLSVPGNTTITGTTTLTGNLGINSSQVTMLDSVLGLHTYANLAPWAADDGKDIGIRMHYYNGADKLAFMGLENSTKTIQFLIDATETASNVTGTYSNVQMGSLVLSNTTASTGTTVATSGALYVAGGAGIVGNIWANNIIANVTPAITSTPVTGVGYIGMPQNATGSTTLTIADAGKHIYVTSTGQTITIPANSSVAYPVGTTIAFIGGPSATTTTIAITTDTMYLAGTGTTGSRTLAAYGMATAVKVAATTWYINGSGLT